MLHLSQLFPQFEFLKVLNHTLTKYLIECLQFIKIVFVLNLFLLDSLFISSLDSLSFSSLLKGFRVIEMMGEVFGHAETMRLNKVNLFIISNN